MARWDKEAIHKWKKRGFEEEDFELLQAKPEERAGGKEKKFEAEMKHKIIACKNWIHDSLKAPYESSTNGKARIGTHLELRPDIYAVAFIY